MIRRKWQKLIVRNRSSLSLCHIETFLQYLDNFNVSRSLELFELMSQTREDWIKFLPRNLISVRFRIHFKFHFNFNSYSRSHGMNIYNWLDEKYCYGRLCCWWLMNEWILISVTDVSLPFHQTIERIRWALKPNYPRRSSLCTQYTFVETVLWHMRKTE